MSSFNGTAASPMVAGLVQREASSPVPPPASEGGPRTVRRCAEVFQKTAVCRFYPKCFKGDSCRFAHAKDELRHRPNLSKTRLCAGFYDGRCRLSADECSFAHGEQELREREVPYFGTWHNPASQILTNKATRPPSSAVQAVAAKGLPLSQAFGASNRSRYGASTAGSTVSGNSTPRVATRSHGSGSSTPSADGAPEYSSAAEATSSWQSMGDMCPPPNSEDGCSIVDPDHTEPRDEQAEQFDGAEGVVAKWMQRIVAMQNASSESGRLPTPEQCTAALMKAMPEYYED